MFVYDNGKVCVFTALRCGHTSMYAYFGIEEWSRQSDIRQWIWSPTKSKKVIVLRNPVERIISAQRRVDYFDVGDKGADFENHSSPYLVGIPKYLHFYVIDFRNLPDYIPVSPKTLITNSSGSTSVDFYINNSKYTKEDLDREMEIYYHFLVNKPKITPAEWKELTT